MYHISSKNTLAPGLKINEKIKGQNILIKVKCENQMKIVDCGIKYKCFYTFFWSIEHYNQSHVSVEWMNAMANQRRLVTTENASFVQYAEWTECAL